MTIYDDLSNQQRKEIDKNVAASYQKALKILDEEGIDKIPYGLYDNLLSATKSSDYYYSSIRKLSQIVNNRNYGNYEFDNLYLSRLVNDEIFGGIGAIKEDNNSSIKKSIFNVVQKSIYEAFRDRLRKNTEQHGGEAVVSLSPGACDFCKFLKIAKELNNSISERNNQKTHGFHDHCRCTYFIAFNRKENNAFISSEDRSFQKQFEKINTFISSLTSNYKTNDILNNFQKISKIPSNYSDSDIVDLLKDLQNIDSSITMDMVIDKLSVIFD